MVIDFSASWCGPCKFIEPAIHAMADKFTDVEFIKIDVDELSVTLLYLSLSLSLLISMNDSVFFYLKNVFFSGCGGVNNRM